MFGREGCDPSTFFHYLRQPPAWGLSLWQHSTKAKERHPELHASRSTEARRTQVADATFRDKWRPKALSLTRTGGEIWRSCKQRRNDLEFLHATRAAMGTISNCQGFNTKQIAQNGLETKVKPTPLNRFDKLFASGFHFPCLTLRPLSFKGVVNIPTPIEVVTFTAPVLSALVNCSIPKTKGQIKQRKNFWTRRHRPQCFFLLGNCDRFSGMNASPGKPGALICLGNHATVYHFKRRFLEVKSCLFRPSVLYVFLCHFTVIYTTFTHISATFAHAISTKFIILNAIVVFFDWFLKVAWKTATFQELPLKILWRSMLFRYSGQELGGTGDHRRMALGDLKCCHT